MDPIVVEKTTEVKDKTRKPKYMEKGENGELKEVPQQPKKEFDKERQAKKNERREKRRERNQKERDEEEFNIKKEDITEDTVIPKGPKKNEILKEPTVQEFKNREKQIVEKIKLAREKKGKILAERYEPNKKGDKSKMNDFEKLRQQAFELRKEKESAYQELEGFNNKIKDIKNQMQKIDTEIESYGGRNDNYFERLKRVENDLMTKKLTPKEQKDLTHERDSLRRQVNSVTNKLSGEQLQSRIAQLRQKRKQLSEQLNTVYDEKKPFSQKYTEAKQKYTPINDKFNKEKDERKNLKQSQKSEFEKGKQQFNAKKTKKKEQVDNEINKLEDSIDDLWDEFGDKNRQYKKQQRLISHIAWLTKQKSNIAWKKEKERKDKEYEQRRKENPVIKPKKYTAHVKNCELLIDYCQKLNPKEEQQKTELQNQQPTIEEIQSKLSEDSQWKKQKGVTLIQSKKTQELDVEVGGKKGRKNKKVQTQQEKPKKPASYVHDLGIRNAFADVKVLCPDTADDLEKTIKSLEQKLVEYTKLNDEEETVIQTANETQEESAPVQKQPTQQKKENKKQKLQVKEEDFPSL